MIDYDADKINKLIMDIGFVCNDDKMYSMVPSTIYHYRKNNDTPDKSSEVRI